MRFSTGVIVGKDQQEESHRKSSRGKSTSGLTQEK